MIRRPLALAMIAALALAGSAAVAKPHKAPRALVFEATTTRSEWYRPLARGARLPLVVGRTCYGWRYTFADRNKAEALVETLTLPASAAQWGDTPLSQVAPDRASATTEVMPDPSSGIAFKRWCVLAGDPPGRYRIEVRRAGRLVGRRIFVLTAPARK